VAWNASPVGRRKSFQRNWQSLPLVGGISDVSWETYVLKTIGALISSIGCSIVLLILFNLSQWLMWCSVGYIPLKESGWTEVLTDTTSMEALLKGEGSVQLTSLYQLFWNNFFILKIWFTSFYKTSHPN
jgi:hypothetical protein